MSMKSSGPSSSSASQEKSVRSVFSSERHALRLAARAFVFVEWVIHYLASIGLDESLERSNCSVHPRLVMLHVLVLMQVRPD